MALGDNLLPLKARVGSPANEPFLMNPNYSRTPGYMGNDRLINNPLFFNGGGTFGSRAPGNNRSSSISSGGGDASGGSVRSMGDIFSNISGGGDINFGGNTPEGFNPYQFMPSFSNFQRPSSPVAGLTPEEEFLRQYAMGQLTGAQPGQDLAFNELFNTVSGDYLSPESNPFLGQQINALGALTSDRMNQNINQILDRAGVSGALGGSRAALMQGEMAGDVTNDFNKTISDMLSQNYQTERGRQLGAIPGLLTTEQAPIAQIIQAMGLAGVPREMEQRNIDANMAEWGRMQNERLLPIQTAQSILGQRMGQTVPIVQPQGSPLSGLASLLQGGGALMGGLQNSGLGNLFSNFWGGGGNWSPATTGGGFDAWDMGGFGG